MEPLASKYDLAFNGTTPKKSRARGNAHAATLPRINPAMTVSQLQDECRFRKVTGHSGKNKDWLLQQLGIGTVWQSQKQASTVNEALKITKVLPTKKVTTDESKPAPQQKKCAPVTTKPEKQMTGTESLDWSKLRRVSSTMTIVQLTSELLSRNPSVKGISGKTKAWFLTQLGEGSICQSMVPNSVKVLLLLVPRVSSAMTAKQLVHELSTRVPSLRGL